MTTYEKNIQALQTANLLLTDKLLSIKSNQTFEVFATENLANANILDLKNNIPLHIDEPLIEINKKLKDFKVFHKYIFLYFFGIGNGYFYKQLLRNSYHKKIYIIEPELELIYIALNLVDFSKEIIEKRINIFHSKEIEYAKVINLLDGDEKLYFKVYNLDIYSYFYEKYHEELIRVNGVFTDVFKHFVNICGNDSTDELNGLQYFLQNMSLMLKKPSLKNLIEKGKTTNTAIIVATGPSLAKQLPLLKKIQKYVTIIASDSSLPILQKAGITPDIATSIERHQAIAEIYKKTPKEFLKKIVIALTSVAHKDLIDAVKGMTLQLSMRPTGNYYRYFKFDDWGYIGEGMSTANMAYELASKMNFKQIILIGQDLSFGKDGTSHPKGHVFGTKNHTDDIGVGTEIEAYGGNGRVKTMKWWMLFLNGFVKAIAYNNTHTDTKTINATEGGARIHGAIEMSFADVIEKYIDRTSQKEKIKLDYPSTDEYQKNLQSAVDKLEDVIKIGKSMKKRVEKILSTHTKNINKIGQTEKTDLIKHKKVINKMIEDTKEIRKRYYSDSFNFFTHLIAPLVMHIEFDLAVIHVMPENSEVDRVLKNWETILVHHEWFYRVYVNLEAILKIVENKKLFLVKSLEEELEIA